MRAHNTLDRIRRHPFLTTAAVILLGGLAVEADGYASNRTYGLPNRSCVSPFAVSKDYKDPSTSTLFMTDAGVDTTGLTATGQLPSGVYGIQAAYENPDKPGDQPWHISDMVKAGHAGKFTLKLGIGAGEVRFGVREVAPTGLVTCKEVPKVTFTHADASDYFSSSGQLPWPNPVNVVTNLFS